MVPAAFEAGRRLEALNVGAVGLSLAAVASALIARCFGDPGPMALAAGLATWVVGTLWAWLLRRPKTLAPHGVPWLWSLSVPLAMLDASVTAGLWEVFERGDHGRYELYRGFWMGATWGAFFWIPALGAALVCFGLPILHARRLARRGLAGEERGEWIIGLLCVVTSVVGLGLSLTTSLPEAATLVEGLWMTRGLGVAGALVGLATMFLARGREEQRQRFVADVDAGSVAGYRIDAAATGRVLVRVVPQGEGYRGADIEEEVFDLDVAGQATRAKYLGGVRQPPVR